jgi:D-3-phosphoglycerate dehydrogenase
MTLRVFDPYLEAATIAAAGGEKVALDDLLRRSKYVIVQCLLSDETRNMIGEAELRTMRPDAVLVNTARADVVNEKALFRALREGWIRAAALDVFADHANAEMLALENLVLTPHSGGFPPDYPDATFAAVVEVILAVARGEMPKWIVNQEVKPRRTLKPSTM